MLLSVQIGFNLVNAAVVYSIVESFSGLEPLSVTTEPGYLKIVTVSSFFAFTLIFLLMPLVLFVTSLVLISKCQLELVTSSALISKCRRLWRFVEMFK